MICNDCERDFFQPTSTIDNKPKRKRRRHDSTRVQTPDQQHVGSDQAKRQNLGADADKDNTNQWGGGALTKLKGESDEQASTRRQRQAETAADPSIETEADDSGSSVGDVNTPPQGMSADTNLQDEDEQYYHIEQVESRAAPRFKARSSTYTLRYNLSKCDDVHEVLVEGMSSLIETAFAGAALTDKVGLSIRHPNLDKAVHTGLRARGEMSTATVLGTLERVRQSAKIASVDEEFEFEAVTIQLPGRARGPPAPVNWEKYLRERMGFHSCVVKVVNRDKLCVPRAICMGIARLKRGDGPAAETAWDRIRRGDAQRNTAQKRAAEDLMRRAGLGVGPCGLDELRQLQAVLVGEYKIKVYDTAKCLTRIFNGVGGGPCIYIVLNGGHAYLISSITAFMKSSFWCDECSVGYRKRTDHVCPTSCRYCRRQGHGTCPKQTFIHCNKCRRNFPSTQCLTNHLEVARGAPNTPRGKSICQLLKICDKCKRSVKSGSAHHCGMVQCKVCHVWTPSRGKHTCFIRPIKQKKKKTKELEVEGEDGGEDGEDEETSVSDQGNKLKRHPCFIFFDFECRQDVVYSTSEDGVETFQHIPNLVVAQTVCEDCYNDEWQSSDSCATCGEHEVVFRGDTCLREFVDWLFTDRHRGYTALAHYGRSYDNNLILREVLKRGIKVEAIANGLSMMKLVINGVTLLDTFSFLPMALAKLPAAFGIVGAAKGYFCHHFNRVENQGFKGDYPPAQAYGVDQMKAPQRAKFLEWHAQQNGKHFDFDVEILAYCRSDVSVLRQSAMKFRELFLDMTGLDCFLSAVTIASLCMTTFRTLFLKPRQIAIVPVDGYRARDRQSKIGLAWIKYISKSENKHIDHARNGGEFKIGPYRLDGFHDDGAGVTTAYEFNVSTYVHTCVRTCAGLRV